MFKRKINLVLLGLLLGTLLFTVACSSDSNNNGSKDNATESEDASDVSRELVIGYETDISSYDPTQSSVGNDLSLLWPVFDTLITFNAELEPQPGLAESWELEDDQTLILNLREGVTFHDGTAFDAEAVKFNIERVNSEESKVSDLQSVESVEVIDESTVKLHLNKPDASVLMTLANREGMIVSPSAVEESGEDFAQNPIGAGPYKMVKHVPNGEIILEAYEDYWDEGKPYLDKLTIKVMDDENVRINALKSGEIDFANELSPNNVKSLENDPNIILDGKMSLFLKTLFINVSKPPFDNKLVRQAVLHGINREEIVQAINYGMGEVATQAFPTDYWAADNSLAIEYDPEKARKLLEESGETDVVLRLNHYPNAYDTTLAEALKSQLAEVGIELDLQSMELQAAVANHFTEKESHAILAAWTGSPDPHIAIKGLFSKDSFYNAGDYSTDEIEQLITDAIAVSDQSERSKLYGEISEAAILDEALTIPLFLSPINVGLNEKVKGFDPNLLGKPMFTDLRVE